MFCNRKRKLSVEIFQKIKNKKDYELAQFAHIHAQGKKKSQRRNATVITKAIYRSIKINPRTITKFSTLLL